MLSLFKDSCIPEALVEAKSLATGCDASVRPAHQVLHEAHIHLLAKQLGTLTVEKLVII